MKTSQFRRLDAGIEPSKARFANLAFGNGVYFSYFQVSRKTVTIFSEYKNNDYGTEKIYCFLRVITSGTGE